MSRRGEHFHVHKTADIWKNYEGKWLLEIASYWRGNETKHHTLPLLLKDSCSLLFSQNEKASMQKQSYVLKSKNMF